MPLLAPESRLNPFPTYERMRREGGVARLGAQGPWGVYRYEDVRVVLGDNARFSSAAPGANGPQSLLQTDPPRHTQLRSLVSRAFSPRTVAQMERRIAGLAEDLLDVASERGTFDVVADLANPLPVMVIAEMLGVAPEDRDRFKHWSDVVVGSSDAILDGGQRLNRDQHERAWSEMIEYFSRTIEQRRAAPREDLISGLLGADVDGDRLSMPDILHFCWLLLVAGNETTTNLIGNAARCFMEEEGAPFARLRAEPDLLASAVEEVLRYRSPVQAMFRYARGPVELHGRHIDAGERLVAWIGSANRDPNRFPDPEHFDMARSPNPHVAFGNGIHFCLGAPLARLEARIALAALILRQPPDGWHLAADAPPLEPVSGFILHGVRAMAMAGTPTPRCGRRGEVEGDRWEGEIS